MKYKPKQINPVELAVKFHNTYEKFAPFFGYKTREETKHFDKDSKNGRLMIAVCREILTKEFPEHYDYDTYVKWKSTWDELNPYFKELE